MKVDIDFNGLYTPSTIQDLNVKFIQTYGNVLEIIEKQIKDRDSKLLLQKLKTTNDITQSNIIIIYYNM